MTLRKGGSGLYFLSRAELAAALGQDVVDYLRTDLGPLSEGQAAAWTAFIVERARLAAHHGRRALSEGNGAIQHGAK